MQFKDTMAVLVGLPLLGAAIYIGYLLVRAPDPHQQGQVVTVAVDSSGRTTQMVLPSVSNVYTMAAEAHTAGDMAKTVGFIQVADGLINEELAGGTLAESAETARRTLRRFTVAPDELRATAPPEFRRLLGDVHFGLAQHYGTRASGTNAGSDMMARDRDLRAATHHLRRMADFHGERLTDSSSDFRRHLDNLMSTAGVAATNLAGNLAVQGRDLLQNAEQDLKRLEATLDERLGNVPGGPQDPPAAGAP